MAKSLFDQSNFWFSLNAKRMIAIPTKDDWKLGMRMGSPKPQSNHLFFAFLKEEPKFFTRLHLILTKLAVDKQNNIFLFCWKNIVRTIGTCKK